MLYALSLVFTLIGGELTAPFPLIDLPSMEECRSRGNVAAELLSTRPDLLHPFEERYGSIEFVAWRCVAVQDA